MQVTPIDITQKLGQFSDHWAPRLIAELNGQHVKLTKLKGDFVWHHHADEDELFFVLDGRLRMDMRDGSVWVEKGQMIVMPRGVEHKPFAEEEVSILLFEPASTVNTGNVVSERTRTTTPRL